MSNAHKSSFRPLRLETPRLILRHFLSSDLPTLLAYRNDPEVARYQGWGSLTETEARAFIEAQRVQPVAVPHAWLQIALELKGTGQHIGDLALNVDGERQAELGYSLDRAFQGYGYATEAVAALLDLGFTHLKLHRMVAHTDVRNAASIKLLERIGFRREGHLLENFYDKGEWTSEYLYALLAREWRPAQQ
jgi:RimJ/RimL family protein N-acetyltransferase